MAREPSSKPGYASQRLVMDTRSMRRDGGNKGVTFWRSVLIVVWLAVVVRSGLALL